MMRARGKVQRRQKQERESRDDPGFESVSGHYCFAPKTFSRCQPPNANSQFPKCSTLGVGGWELGVDSLLRFLPALLEMLFPVLGPRPPEVVDVTRVHRSQLGRPPIWAVDDGALHTAFDVGESLFRIVDRPRALPWRDGMQRTR